MSIRGIATLTKLSPATVSLALQKSPKISAATRERVLKAARQTGYKPDAKVTELMSRIRQAAKPGDGACLGVVSLYDTPRPWENSLHLTRMYRGMTGRARVIARFLSKSDGLREHRQASLAEKHLRKLTTLRQHCVEKRNRLISHEEHPADCALVGKKIKQRRRSLEKDIKELEKEIEKVAKSEPGLKARVERCREVQGVAITTAAGLLGHMPEPGACEPGCCAALAGLAPFCRQSGNYDGKRHIGGGRSEVRRILHMAALGSLRCNPILKPVYRRHRANGKLPKVAMVAIMRKLIELINHILKNPDFHLFCSLPAK